MTNVLSIVLCVNLLSVGGEPIDIGPRFVLLVDRQLIDEFSGQAQQGMHHSTPRDVDVKFDIDGFGSVQTPISDGDLFSRPLVFNRRQAMTNLSSSAAGDVRGEIQDAGRNRLEGYTLDDCLPVFGEALEWTVHWKASSDVSQLAGRAVWLHFVLWNTNLYSFWLR